MANEMKDYVENFRANLPVGITYDSTIGRYFCNDRRFLNEWEVERYLNYIKKFGFAPLLLDQFTGAAAAYSLRALSKDTTSVVRVRRSSDNAEADFTPDEITDGSLLTWVGTGGTDNGYVTTWYDQSGNGNDATQTVAISQPKIVEGGALVTEGGKATLDFDGVDDGFIAPNIQVRALFAAFSQNGRSDFISPTSNRIFLEADKFQIQPLSPSVIIPLPVNYTDGRELLLSYNNNASKTLVINRDEYSDPDATTESFFLNRIGYNDNNIEYLDGIFQELILYPSDQSANRTDIESNIDDYYGITLS